MKPNPITGILGVRPRDDYDTAAQAEHLEQIPGEMEFDRIAKAQAMMPQVSKRITELEDCLWALTEALIAHEREPSPLVERARLLLNNKLEILDSSERAT